MEMKTPETWLHMGFWSVLKKHTDPGTPVFTFLLDHKALWNFAVLGRTPRPELNHFLNHDRRRSFHGDSGNAPCSTHKTIGMLSTSPHWLCSPSDACALQLWSSIDFPTTLNFNSLSAHSVSLPPTSCSEVSICLRVSNTYLVDIEIFQIRSNMILHSGGTFLIRKSDSALCTLYKTIKDSKTRILQKLSYWLEPGDLRQWWYSNLGQANVSSKDSHSPRGEL